jgi:hypothetical protein
MRGSRDKKKDRKKGVEGKGYTVKKVIDFPVPSREVTNQTLSGRE